jgi:hypothetical protein
LNEAINPSGTMYGALVNYKSWVDDHLDRWALAVCDLTKGGAVTELVLEPWILSQVSDVAGLGFPKQ